MENAKMNTPSFTVVGSEKEKRPPKTRQRPENFTKEEYRERGIIHPSMNNPEVLNAFRNLRNSMLSKAKAFNSIIQVTTVKQGGGASFNAINLATSCAFDQHRHALLIDCNFPRPSLATTLNIEPEYGLYDFLTGHTDNIESIIYPTGIPRLSLVPSGEVKSEDHVECFTGEKMRLFLENVKNRYSDRAIILDTPPVLESTDAKILSELVDYVVVVIPYKGASASKINKIVQAVGKEKIAGMVLNN